MLTKLVRKKEDNSIGKWAIGLKNTLCHRLGSSEADHEKEFVV